MHKYMVHVVNYVVQISYTNYSPIRKQKTIICIVCDTTRWWTTFLCGSRILPYLVLYVIYCILNFATLCSPQAAINLSVYVRGPVSK